jgi:hypothetical protein
VAAPRFLPQGGRALPKSGAPGTQGFFEDHAVFGLCAPPMLGGSSLQCFNHVLGNISYEELWHLASRECYHMIANRASEVQIRPWGGVGAAGVLDFQIE